MVLATAPDTITTLHAKTGGFPVNTTGRFLGDPRGLLLITVGKRRPPHDPNPLGNWDPGSLSLLNTVILSSSANVSKKGAFVPIRWLAI